MDQLNFAQLDHLQSKYAGCGNADTTPLEWARTQHRDTMAVLIGQPSLLAYWAAGQGMHTEKMRYQLLQVPYIQNLI